MIIPVRNHGAFAFTTNSSLSVIAGRSGRPVWIFYKPRSSGAWMAGRGQPPPRSQDASAATNRRSSRWAHGATHHAGGDQMQPLSCIIDLGSRQCRPTMMARSLWPREPADRLRRELLWLARHLGAELVTLDRQSEQAASGSSGVPHVDLTFRWVRVSVRAGEARCGLARPRHTASGNLRHRPALRRAV